MQFSEQHNNEFPKGGERVNGRSINFRFSRCFNSDFRSRWSYHRTYLNQPSSNSGRCCSIRRSEHREALHPWSRFLSGLFAAVLALITTVVGAGAASAATDTAEPTQHSIDGWFRSYFTDSTNQGITTDPIQWRDVSFDKKTQEMSIVLFANFPTDVWGEYTPVGLSVSPDFHYASGCPTDQFRTEVVPSNTAGPAAYKFVLDMSCLGATPDYSKIVFQFSYQIWAARWGAPPSPGQYDHQVGWSPSTAYFSLPDYTEAHLSGSPFYDPENPDKYKITDAGLVNSDGVVIQAPKGDTPAVNDFCIKIDNVLRCGALDAASNNTREQICVNRDGATLCGPPACVVESMTTLNSKFCEAQGTYGYCDVPDMFGFAPLIPGYVPQSSKNLNPWAECWTSLYVPKVDPTIRAKKELDNAMTKAPFAWFAATGAMLQSLERFAYLDHDPSLKIAYTNFDYRGLAPGNGAGGVVMGEVPMLNEDSVGSRLMVMVRPILTGALLIGIFYGMYARWARAAFANIYTGKD